MAPMVITVVANGDHHCRRLLWQSPLLQMAMGCIIGHAIGCISA
jgi:hypothetical protein